MATANVVREETRYSRSESILPAEKLKAVHAMVVGVGAIGRQVAIQLSAMGIGELTVIDFDTVDVVNLGPQGFSPNDIGKPKVESVKATCAWSNPDIKINAENGRFRRSMELPKVLFCCVDSMESRKLIWETAQPAVDFFCDSRMSSEVVRILTVTNETSSTHYPTTLFAAAEAFQGSCTAKSTIFCSNIAAGIMLEQFSKFIRGNTPEMDVILDLQSFTLDVKDA